MGNGRGKETENFIKPEFLKNTNRVLSAHMHDIKVVRSIVQFSYEMTKLKETQCHWLIDEV